MSEYWFVDLEAGSVDIHTLEAKRYAAPVRLRRGDVLRSDRVPGFSLDVQVIVGGESGSNL